MTENPQKENGYTSIANEIVDVLAYTKFTTQESRLLWAILRKTYGYNKKEDWVALSQLSKMTGMSVTHVSHTKARLIERNIVAQTGNKIRFSKYYSQWRELPKQAVPKQAVPKQDIGSAQIGNQVVPKQADTKVDTTIVDVTKENTNVSSDTNITYLFSEYTRMSGRRVMIINPKRSKLLRARISDFSIQKIRWAWSRMAVDKFLRGDNENKKDYFTIEYATRFDKIEDYLNKYYQDHPDAQ